MKSHCFESMQPCCICGQIWRKSIKGVEYRSDKYALSKRGKIKKANVFHWDCYWETR